MKKKSSEIVARISIEDSFKHDFLTEGNKIVWQSRYLIT